MPIPKPTPDNRTGTKTDGWLPPFLIGSWAVQILPARKWEDCLLSTLLIVWLCCSSKAGQGSRMKPAPAGDCINSGNTQANVTGNATPQSDWLVSVVFEC